MDKDWTVVYDEEIDHKRYTCHKCMVNTDEDWYPTDEGKLKMSVIQEPRSKFIRICIWGGDDFGMEKDYKMSENTFEDALLEADVIPEPVTVTWLLENGFDYA